MEKLLLILLAVPEAPGCHQKQLFPSGASKDLYPMPIPTSAHPQRMQFLPPLNSHRAPLYHLPASEFLLLHRINNNSFLLSTYYVPGTLYPYLI